MQMTTLCYIENDEKYLMLHRVKKKEDISSTLLIFKRNNQREREKEKTR